MKNTFKPEISWWDINQVIPYALNTKKHPKEQVAQLASAIAEFGWDQPIVVDSDGIIIKGHGRRLAALQLDLLSVPVVVRTDLTEAQKKAARISDNKIAESDWDLDALKVEIEALGELNFDLSFTGFSEDEIGDLWLEETPPAGDGGDGGDGDFQPPEEQPPGAGAGEEEEDEDDYTPPSLDDIVSRVKRGEVWEVAGHRVMCGDCRDAAQVSFLIGDASINLAVTSPPYASRRKYDEKSGFKPIKPDEYVSWYEPVQDIIKEHLTPDGSYFLNIKEHVEDGSRHLYVKKLCINHVEAYGWRLVDEFCWSRAGVPGKWKDRFKNAWEPVFQFAMGKDIKFNPLAVAHASDCMIGDGEVKASASNGKRWNMRASEKKEGLALPGNLLTIASAGSESSGHSAAYPVGLPAFFIQAYSDAGDRVYDPFLGSGTTAVAAHKHNRIGLGMEISDKHCEIILQRLEKATSAIASLVATYEAE